MERTCVREKGAVYPGLKPSSCFGGAPTDYQRRIPMVSQEPRTIRFQFMDIGTQTVSGLLTIFPGEAGAGARIFVSVEGERLRPEGHYTVEVTGDGLSLTASFTADADGRGSATKATVGHVPPTFRPRFAVVGPGF